MNDISYDFKEGQLVELFHGRPQNGWDIYSVPDDVLIAALTFFSASNQKDTMRETELFGHEKFVCIWDSNAATVAVHSADFFCAEHGYQPDDIETLANLLIGESADLSDGIGQSHYVMRFC